MNHFIEKGRWQLNRLIEQLDIFGKLALVLSVLALIAYVFIVMPKQSQLTQQIADSNNQQDYQPTNPALVKEASLKAFANQFPKLHDRANEVKKLMDAAELHAIQLDNVTYDTAHQQNDFFHHYFVDFTIKERYSNTYNFLSDLLTQMPFASIASLSLQRDSTKNENVETKIKLNLHFVQDEKDAISGEMSGGLK